MEGINDPYDDEIGPLFSKRWMIVERGERRPVGSFQYEWPIIVYPNDGQSSLEVGSIILPSKPKTPFLVKEVEQVSSEGRQGSYHERLVIEPLWDGPSYHEKKMHRWFGWPVTEPDAPIVGRQFYAIAKAHGESS
jgi:hypothetical protein